MLDLAYMYYASMASLIHMDNVESTLSLWILNNYFHMTKSG